MAGSSIFCQRITVLLTVSSWIFSNGSPLMLHVIIGSGSPVAEHLKVTVPPGGSLIFAGVSLKIGEARQERKLVRILQVKS